MAGKRDSELDLADCTEHSDSHSMLTVKKASRILGIHPNTLRHWSDCGIITAYRKGSRGDRVFRQEDIDQAARIRVREASQLLSVHPNTLRLWSDRGKIKAYRNSHRGDRMFKADDVAPFTPKGRQTEEGAESNQTVNQKRENANKKT